MAKNKIITSQGNVQFINSKGKTINMHPMHCYAVYEDDTVSFLFIYMKEYSGQAFFASQFEDLEVNGETYDNMDDLKDAINYAFAKAGAQARTEIVEELPEDPFTNTIYLLPKEHGEGYDEYIWNEDEGWQLIGDTDIEFERYLKIDDFNPYSAATKDYIDAVSGETVANHNDIVALSGAIDTEISARTDADAFISGAVDTLSTNLSNEVQRAQNAEQTLQNNINTVNSRVDAEQIARANADNALSGAVDSVASDLASEVSRAEGAESALDSKIDAVSGDVITEASRAEGAEIALGGRIDNEITARTAADNALSGAIDTVDDKVDALSGEVQTMGDEAIVNAEYVSSSTTIDFYNADGTVVAQVDATDFIKDGMIEDVRIENGYLVIDFNTASGIEDIQIPLTDIFDPDNYYDKTAIDNIVSGLNDSIDAKLEISDFNTYSGAVDTAIGGKLEISDFETYSGNVETALGNKFDASAITAYSTTVEVGNAIDAAVSGKVNTSDFNTYSASVETALSGKADLSALTEDERVWGEALNDLNSRINTVSGDVASKASQSAVDALNGVVTAHTANTTVHVTSAEKTTWNNKSDFSGSYNDLTNKLSAGTNITIVDNVINATGGGSTYTAGNGIDITNDVISVTGKVDTSVYNTYTASTNAEISNLTEYKASYTYVDEKLSTKTENNTFEGFVSDFNTYSGAVETRLTEDEEVTSAGLNALNDKFGGLKLMKITQAAYDALTVKDNNTLYIISD